MVEVSESGGGIAMDFVMTDVASSPMPRRLKDRLLELEESACNKPFGTVEDIEAKLLHARMRRQQFYEKLSRKARSKPVSPSRSTNSDVYLGKRIEARLQAAENKRMSILANSQKRLARQDELRQAAKTSVEVRMEKEREVLGCKVELRIQQAEANRIRLLKAYKQRRANLNERFSESSMQRITRDIKHKERICSAIHQKRVAAEKKRFTLVEAEKKRAHARIQQVQQVALSVHHQREANRRKIMNQLESKLQRAKRQRAEYLQQRSRHRAILQMNCSKETKEAEDLSIKLAKCWRQFLKSRTTYALAKDYDSLQINQSTVKSLPFEELARRIESPSAIRTLKSFVDRLHIRFKLFKSTFSAPFSSSLDNINHLLQRVSTPNKHKSSPKHPQRYITRLLLCAYMINTHPDAVLSGHGPRETSLASAADLLITHFETLLCVILQTGPGPSFRVQLSTFDSAWCAYLECFAVWKVKDAEALQEDLIRAACQLERSMINTCKTPLSHDMIAIQKQVREDQNLLREKIRHLSGQSGVSKMDSALVRTRSKKPAVVRSLFQEETNATENEILVNEFLHRSIPLSTTSTTMSTLEDRVRESMETVFWESVEASTDVDYQRIVQLVTEVRDELCRISPVTWKQEIHDAIDVHILSQLIGSGSIDAAYLGDLLRFSFGVLRKLTSPAKETEMQSSQTKFLNELTKFWAANPPGRVVVKGLRFVLEEISGLKKEISKARILMMEPFLKGPAGLDYLRTAFSRRFGSAVPVTKDWVLSVKGSATREWDEHLSGSSLRTAPVRMRTGHGDSVADPVPTQDCNGEIVDLVVRIGVLKLVFGIAGLTVESAPETLRLNVNRLRAMQEEVQKLILGSTAVLVLRQTRLLDQSVPTGEETQRAFDKLMKLLDQNADVDLGKIVECISGDDVEECRKAMMMRMVEKSVQPLDPVFEKVSRAVYAAMRSVVLGGDRWREKVEAGLRQIGAHALVERVMECAEMVRLVAVVSVGVHRPWYASIVGN